MLTNMEEYSAYLSRKRANAYPANIAKSAEPGYCENLRGAEMGQVNSFIMGFLESNS